MKNTFMVIDTETTTHDHMAYDVGFVICDKHGKIVEHYQSLVEEVITSPENMRAAFYHRKVFERYIPMLSSGETTVRKWSDIFDRMKEAIEQHKVTVIAAYNLAFDARVMGLMQERFGDGSRMLQEHHKTLCLWNLACMTRLNTARFRNTADNFGWKSEKGNYKTSAEIAYRYMMHSPDFVEDHTALADCIVEVAVMAECLASKKAIPYDDKAIAQPWRLVQRSATE